HRAHDEHAERRGVASEVPASVALVADEDRAALAPEAPEQLQGDLALAAGRIGEREGTRRAVGSGEQVAAEAPVPARVAAAVAVAGGIGELRAFGRLAALGAGHRGRVDEQEVIVEARA